MTGFESKREAAADKLQETVSFPCCGYTDANAIRWNQFNGVVQCHMCGQVYTVAQPAQEPPSEWAGIKAILDEYGLQAIDFVADFKAALAQPAQEPVAIVNVRPLMGHESIPQTIIKWKNGRPVAGPLYTAPPQREWVGLTDEDKSELAKAQHSWEDLCLAVEAKLKERNHGT